MTSIASSIHSIRVTIIMRSAPINTVASARRYKFIGPE